MMGKLTPYVFEQKDTISSSAAGSCLREKQDRKHTQSESIARETQDDQSFVLVRLVERFQTGVLRSEAYKREWQARTKQQKLVSIHSTHLGSYAPVPQGLTALAGHVDDQNNL
jgi:hypothetical protein